MFAALVRSRGDVTALAATLGSLVEGAAAGLVGHAVVIVSGSPGQPELAEELAALADAMGAELVMASGDDQADWQKAAQAARGDWVMTINAGEVFAQGWIAAIERFAMTSGGGRIGIVPRTGWHGLCDRLAGKFLSGRFLPGRFLPRRIRGGHIMPRAWLAVEGAAPASPRQPLILGIRRETLG